MSANLGNIIAEVLKQQKMCLECTPPRPESDASSQCSRLQSKINTRKRLRFVVPRGNLKNTTVKKRCGKHVENMWKTRGKGRVENHLEKHVLLCFTALIDFPHTNMDVENLRKKSGVLRKVVWDFFLISSNATRNLPDSGVRAARSFLTWWFRSNWGIQTRIPSFRRVVRSADFAVFWQDSTNSEVCPASRDAEGPKTQDLLRLTSPRKQQQSLSFSVVVVVMAEVQFERVVMSRETAVG